ncbi:hypothetical protein LIER_38051 [Lithospermum erythrorhizon]|uniref:Uncharacterized protein n=1 Tax=Lithospermum erythrorhizon TaxID=34254 RepID=A0AAV3PTZ7_LITER
MKSVREVFLIEESEKSLPSDWPIYFLYPLSRLPPMLCFTIQLKSGKRYHHLISASDPSKDFLQLEPEIVHYYHLKRTIKLWWFLLDELIKLGVGNLWSCILLLGYKLLLVQYKLLLLHCELLLLSGQKM